MIRFAEKFLFVVLSCGALVSCDVSEVKAALEDGGEWSPAELDETVEDIWLDTNEGTLVALGEWLGSDPKNTLEWISNEDALVLEKTVRDKYGVELCAISEADMPNYTVSVVAKLPLDVDREGLEKLLVEAPSVYRVEVLMGNRWLTLDGLLSDNGEYVRK